MKFINQSYEQVEAYTKSSNDNTCKIKTKITRFDCVWMQTQKSPNDPHIRNLACGCKFHH